MGAQNSKKHLALVRANAKKAKTSSAEVSFFLIRRKKTQDGILHLDLKSGREARYKNPLALQQLLLKNAALGYQKGDAFFEGASALVSCAGTVRFDGTQWLISPTISTGKGKPKDIEACMKGSAFKFLKPFTISAKSTTPEAPEAALGEPVLALLRDGALPEPSELYAAAGSVDELFGLLSTLRDRLDSAEGAEAAALEALLEALDAQLAALDAWSLEPLDEASAAGLAEGLDLLGALEFDEAAADLTADTVAEVRSGWVAFRAALEARLQRGQDLIRSLGGALEEALADGSLEEGPDPALVAWMVGCTIDDLKDRLFGESMASLDAQILALQPEKLALGADAVDAVIAQLERSMGAMLCSESLVSLEQIAPSIGAARVTLKHLERLGSTLRSLKQHLG